MSEFPSTPMVPVDAGKRATPSVPSHSKTAQRNESLDFLRGLAIALVLVRHMEVCPESVNQIFSRLTSIGKTGGWVGVDLFFTLSGFLVSGLLFREHLKFRQISIGSFLVRRGLKIYPAFYFFIFVTVVGHLIVNGKVPLNILFWEVTFLQNYGAGFWDHTWSLAVEEHFYILLPLLLLLGLRFARGGKAFGFVPGLFVLVALVSLVLRVFISFTKPFDHTTHVFHSHIRMDSLMFGVCLSYFYHYSRERFLEVSNRFRPLLLLAGFLSFAPAFVFSLKSPFMTSFGFTALYLGSGCLLVALVPVQLPSFLGLRRLASVGAFSYGIYLWHLPVLAVVYWSVRKLGLTPGLSYSLKLALYFVGSIVLGVFMTRLIEIPVLRCRDRWFPSRSNPV